MGGDGSPYGMVATSTAQILFDKPEAMQVSWDVSGVGQYDSVPLVVPGRQNFSQGGIYRLKLTNISGREGVELYPTLEVAHMTRRTAAYLNHSAVPIQFTDEDFDQVMAGNFVTKVIYVPDPEFQELALAGVDTLVSTRLDPGIDPVTEADRRGSVLAIVRIGNKDMGLPDTQQTADVMYGGPASAAGIHMAGTSNYISGSQWSELRNAPCWYPAGIARTSAPSDGRTGRTAGLLDVQPHRACDSWSDSQRQRACQAKARFDLSAASRHHPGSGTTRFAPPHFNAQPPADMVQGNIRDCGNCGGQGCGYCR